MSKQRLALEGPAMDAAHLRRAMGRFVTGVAVVTTCGPDGKREGITVNSFSTVSLDPPLVLWSLARSARSFAAFDRAEHFAISVLGSQQMHLVKHFATPQSDKLAGIPHEIGYGDCPVLTGAIAHFECRRETTVEGGDHKIYIGRILRLSYRPGDPLAFSSGTFATVTPVAAEAVA